jgi:hypothetical protein
MTNPCQKRKGTPNACSASICFQKTMTARTESTAAFFQVESQPSCQSGRWSFRLWYVQVPKKDKSFLRFFVAIHISSLFWRFIQLKIFQKQRHALIDEEK